MHTAGVLDEPDSERRLALPSTFLPPLYLDLLTDDTLPCQPHHWLPSPSCAGAKWFPADRDRQHSQQPRNETPSIYPDQAIRTNRLSLLGSNLSQGQRQLVSLARAMLTPSNILVLDEATAAVDVQTDAMLQATLRGPLFANRTIVTVAHRINTIMDSDRVVVLDKGEVVEFDTPAELIRRKGVFWGLVREAGLLDGE